MAASTLAKFSEFSEQQKWTATGLVFLATQNVIDFNLSLTAISLPAISLWALLSPSTVYRVPARKFVVAVSLSVLAISTVTLWALPHSLGDDTQTLRRALMRGETPTGETVSSIVRRHPTDAIVPLIIAESLHGDGELQEAMAWVNRGMYLNPHFSGSHRLAARIIYGLGRREQGLIEYRLAIQSDSRFATDIAREILSRNYPPSTLLELAPLAPESSWNLAKLALDHGAPQTTLDLLEGHSSPNSHRHQELRAQALLRRGQAEEAIEIWNQLRIRAPHRTASHLQYASYLMKMRKLPEALEVLETGIHGVNDPAPLYERKALVLLAQRRPREAQRSIERSLRSERMQRKPSPWFTLGTALDQLNHTQEARRSYLRAHQLAPTNAAYLGALVQLEIGAGDMGAAKAWLLKMDHSSPRWAQLQATIRDAEAPSQPTPEASSSD
jgi:predicted Zn-dependent protease